MARYDAFLLRIWHSGDGPGEQWSIRLQHVPDGQIARLGSLDGLETYLRAVLSVEGAHRVEQLTAEVPPEMAPQSEA
jgi:hypothetical protein